MASIVFIIYILTFKILHYTPFGGAIGIIIPVNNFLSPPDESPESAWSSNIEHFRADFTM